MAKLTRYLQKIFANNSNQVGVFGTGTDKVTSKNVETLQSSDYEDGWSAAIVTEKNYPIWQEMDGVQYGLSYQLKYLFQNGIPEWLSTETYYTNQYCRFGNNIYYSLQDNNTNHNPSTATSYWALFHKLPSQTGNSGKYLTTNGTTPSWTEFTGANQDLSNLTATGENRLHALKSYEDAGELLTDAEGLADVTAYAHSTFDSSKFTVTGTPTITDDGVASGFSSSNYLAKTLESTTANSFSFICSFTTPNALASGVETVFVNTTTTLTSSLGVSVFINNGKLGGYVYNGSSFIASSTTGTYQLTTNQKYWVKLEFTGTAYKLSYSLNGIDWTQIWSVASTTSYLQQYIRIGLFYNGTQSLTSSVDLKHFSLAIDGASVFSGNQTGTDVYTINSSTVTIPYTLSKTGSKIVDSIYRTEVASVYGEFGFAPYYTLGINNFTLPQGELYGMLQSYCEGQWTRKYLQIAGSVNLPTSINDYYSLASYLPNDGYNYEVIIKGILHKSAGQTSTSYLGLFSSIAGVSGEGTGHAVTICCARGLDSAQMYAASSIHMPVGTSRQIWVGFGAGYTGTYDLQALGYRRLGRNK